MVVNVEKINAGMGKLAKIINGKMSNKKLQFAVLIIFILIINISFIHAGGIIKDDWVTDAPEEIIEEQITEPKIIPNSYIIELQKPPVIEQQVALQEEKQEAGELASIGLLSEDIVPDVTEEEVEEIQQELEDEHVDALNDIAFLLDEPGLASYKPGFIGLFKLIWDFITEPFKFILSKAGVTGFAISEEEITPKLKYEYFTLFNGLAMEISAEQAEIIKQSPYVKKVYPDTESHILLSS